ncbi:MAG: hypothetical protein CEE38_03765 [Planctomycetes bacterium B3_Pla]|nr:MAG: hypothetical protein CEE38_03765 [Planctomycetes bacterium B3_Pla]
MAILNSALVEYAKEHDGRFPSADQLESILKALEPYFSQDRIRYSVLVAVCPLGGAYERHPKRYEWDTSFSGVSMRDIDPDQFFQEKVPFSCPYHEQMGSRATFTLTEQIFNARYSKDPNKTDAGDGL